MSHHNSKTGFVGRFDTLWSNMRRVSVGRAIFRTLLVVTVGIASLAALDYWFEIAWNVRAAGLAGLGIVSAFLAGVWVIGSIRRWSRPKTAAEIEQHFPQLGQSVRTTVQFGGRDEEVVIAEGVAPTLVAALEEETDIRTRPLGIDTIVPTRRLKTAGLLAGAAISVLLGAAAVDWEWRVATQRALLGNQPYTQLAVSPGDTTVEQGQGALISMELEGRTDRRVLLYSRPAGQKDAKWTKHELSADDATASEPRKLTYETVLENLTEPIEYRVVAGPVESRVFQVGIQYPLSIKDFKIDLTPPEYTGVQPSTVDDGNLNVIDGTRAKFRIELDREPKTAQLVFVEPGAAVGAADTPSQSDSLPLNVDGNLLSLDLELTQDRTYSIVAEAADGTRIPENRFRIRVRKDQPPKVWFEKPNEALEVHSLAEILMRIRVRDDFGISRTGIVFEVNNEEEYPLLTEDFQAAVEELKNGGRLTPRTQAALEKVLPLEYFQLTQKDSVSYYAFAEDNYPGETRRTETDLRFIDIRPFKRRYRMADEEDMPNGDGPRLVTLDELIARQRYALNRNIRLAKASKGTSQADLNTVDRLIEFESKLASSTGELAESLEGVGIDGSDLLFQAQSAMLAAVDSLSFGKFENATLQEKDALRLLIEGRNKVEIALGDSDQALLQKVRRFDRTQAQKLRKPEKDEEESKDVVERLRELAEEEEFVYKTLAAMLGGSNPTDEPQETEEGEEGSNGTKGKTGKEKDQAKDDSHEKGEEPGKKEEGSSGDKDNEKTDTAGSSEKEAKKDGGGSDKQDGSKNENGGSGDDEQKPAGMSREEVEKRQTDIVLEAHDLELILQGMDGISELARSRISKAAKTADEVSGALARGDTKRAAKQARKSAQMLRELARNVEALLTPETAGQIAMARDLADRLSQLERRLGKQMNSKGSSPSNSKTKPKTPNSKRAGKSAKDKSKQPGQGASKRGSSKENGSGGESDSEESGADGEGTNGVGKLASKLADRSARLAESGKTLEDVLKAIVNSTDVGDQEATRRVEELMKEENVSATVRRMQQLPPALLAGRFRDAKLETADIADRLESTSQKLDALHRSIVTPRVEELMVLEKSAVKLQEELNQLETNREITDWHREAAGLVEDMQQASAGGGGGDELLDVMRDAGWGQQTKQWNWERGGGSYYGAPLGYHRSVRKVVEELQEQIQQLVLGDYVATDDGPTPPGYEHMVERYFKVLSSQVR